jgi:LacI family transcriptional regulator
VITDDHASARQAVQLFVERGHTRIGMVDANPADETSGNHGGIASAAADRIGGYVAGMGDAGLGIRAEWMMHPPGRDGIQPRVRALLAQPDRPTAILANNSDVALAVVLACAELDLAVGQDVSLITFDDAAWTRVVSPQISVIARPVEQMGELAVAALLARIRGDRSRTTLVLANRLLDRGSVASHGARST